METGATLEQVNTSLQACVDVDVQSAGATQDSRDPMAGCAQSVSQEHTRQPVGMPLARAARQIQTLLQAVSQSQPALAILAPLALTEDHVTSVLRAHTR